MIRYFGFFLFNRFVPLRIVKTRLKCRKNGSNPDLHPNAMIRLQKKTGCCRYRSGNTQDKNYAIPIEAIFRDLVQLRLHY